MTFIYLIRDDFTGLYKIGRSKDPQYRLKDLRREYTKLPLQFDFRLIAVWEEVHPKAERFIHEIFQNERVRGEWFYLDHPKVDPVKHFFAIMKILTPFVVKEAVCQ